jgi:hypothetical protein
VKHLGRTGFIRDKLEVAVLRGGFVSFFPMVAMWVSSVWLGIGFVKRLRLLSAPTRLKLRLGVSSPPRVASRDAVGAN